MKKNLFLLITLISVLSVTAQNDERLKGLEKELNEILTATKAAGFAVAIVEKDKISSRLVIDIFEITLP